MTSFLKNCFSRKSKSEVEQVSSAKVYDVDSYDATFAIPRAILRLVGLRITRDDSTFVRLLWNVFYWFEFGNLFVVTWLELVNMAQTARGGSFQDAVEIFRMMPCVGYLLLAMAKSYKIVYHRSVYENLVSELRGMWPRGEVSDEEHQVVSTALRHLNYVIQENLVSELRGMWPRGEVSDEEHQVVSTALRHLNYVIQENLVSELRGMWPRGEVSDEEHQVVSTALRHLNYVIQENLVSELRGMWPRGEVSDEEHQVVSTALRHLNYVIQENLVSELRGMWPRGEVSDEEHRVVSTALRHLNYVIQGYYWCNNALLVIFLSPPFVEIIKILLGYDVPLILPFFYWFPFDPFQRGYYEVILVAQTWHGK
ncbi:hypothetical protein PYW07_010120 [Mythimna separata]|uniref:Uncharacterized protein n=1 Tax=Mythimna separata TaxID=271217 RepID=A0AAD8DRF0_MYTSE|nr:hypothetical protein PYW07_010120 [Mythimna separata]